jgi:hypothetical protein
MSSKSVVVPAGSCMLLNLQFNFSLTLASPSYSSCSSASKSLSYTLLSSSYVSESLSAANSISVSYFCFSNLRFRSMSYFSLLDTFSLPWE